MIVDKTALQATNFFSMMHVWRLILDQVEDHELVNTSDDPRNILVKDNDDTIYFTLEPYFIRPEIQIQFATNKGINGINFIKTIKIDYQKSIADQLNNIIDELTEISKKELTISSFQFLYIELLSIFFTMLKAVHDVAKDKYAVTNEDFIYIVNKLPTTKERMYESQLPSIKEQTLMSVQTTRKQAHVIVLEGLDASGKTTAGKYLSKRLTEQGLSVHLINSETVAKSTASIRSLFISDDAGNFTEDVLSMLVSAYNTQIIETEIIPRLDKFDFIIVDRLYHSTAAYQWRSMVADVIIEQLYDLFVPDTLIFLDVSYQTALSRKANMGDKLDHFEAPDRYKFNSRRKAYLSAFKNYTIKDTVVINANEDISRVNKALKDVVASLTY